MFSLAELQISSTSLLDEPKIDYSCPVCAGLHTEPFLTDCGHLVCGACRDRLLTTNKNDCPVCRETNVLSNARLDKRFQREVYSLKVHCQYHDEGCEWVGEVRDIQKHLDPERGNCSYVAAMMEQHQQTTCEHYGFRFNRKCYLSISPWLDWECCTMEITINLKFVTCFFSLHGISVVLIIYRNWVVNRYYYASVHMCLWHMAVSLFVCLSVSQISRKTLK